MQRRVLEGNLSQGGPILFYDRTSVQYKWDLPEYVLVHLELGVSKHVRTLRRLGLVFGPTAMRRPQPVGVCMITWIIYIVTVEQSLRFLIIM